MKKTLLSFTIIIALIGTNCLAQDSETDQREKLSFGGRLGINNSNIYASHGQDFESYSKTGVMFGIFAAVPVNKYLGFQPELSISQKGFYGSGTLLGSSYSIKRTITFIDIPVLVQIKPIEFLTILIGPEFSYLIAEKNKYEFGTNSQDQQAEFDKETSRKTYLGFVAGADINISHIIISGRIGCDILNNTENDNLITPSYKNNWIQIGIGYRL